MKDRRNYILFRPLNFIASKKPLFLSYQDKRSNNEDIVLGV